MSKTATPILVNEQESFSRQDIVNELPKKFDTSGEKRPGTTQSIKKSVIP
jgi:hypothetical protein